MARDDDYYENQRKQREAEELSERLVSKDDGKILGGLFTVPEPVAIALGTFQPWLAGKLAEFGEGHLTKGFTAVAKRLPFKNPEAVGGKIGKGAAYALPYAFNILDMAATSREHFDEKKKLLAQIEPLINANKQSHKGKGMLSSVTGVFDDGYSDNKMVQHALKRLREDTFSKLTVDAVKAIPSVIVNYGTKVSRDHRIAVEERDQLEQGIEKEYELKFSKSFSAGNSEDHYNVLKAEKDRALKEGLGKHDKLIAELEKKHKDIGMLEVGSGGLSTGIGKYMQHRNDARASETSLDKVMQLSQFIKDQGIDNPNYVASDSAIAQVADKVEDIFQTFQKEQGRKHIPTHRMREVSKTLAEELVGGELHALSLVNLVGNDRLMTEKKDGIVSTETIDKVIKDELKVFSKSSTITAQDYLDTQNYTLDDVRMHLKSTNADERALAVLVHPDSVLMEADPKLKKEDIKAMRDHLSTKMQQGVYGAVMDYLAKQTDEQLEKEGFARESIEFVRDHEGQNPANAMKSRANVERFKTVTATTLMSRENKGPDGTLWRDVIAAGKEAAKGGHHAKHGPAANDESFTSRVRPDQAANDERAALASGDIPTRSRSPIDFAAREQGPQER